MSTTTYGNCLLFHGGGLCPVSNYYLSSLANEIGRQGIFEQIYMGFFSFECLLNSEEFIKPWSANLRDMCKKAYGGFYGTSREIDLTVPELQSQAIATCKNLGITWIGVAGGDGSCRQVAEISEAFEAEGIHLFIPMPLTIDGIEGGFSGGVLTAVQNSKRVLEDLAATNLQTRDNRKFSVLFLELQGRNRDDILANLMQIVEMQKSLGGIPLDDIDLFTIPANYYYDINKLIEEVKDSKKRTVVLYSEGAEFPLDYIIESVERKSRASKVGYLSQMSKIDFCSYSFDQEICAKEIEILGSQMKECIEKDKSFSMVLKDPYIYTSSIEPIYYWAKLNPREGQKPTLPKMLEELLKKYTPQ